MSKEAVSEPAWPTNPQSFHQIKALFQEPDADVILEISEAIPYSDPPTSITYAFKAHKHKLAAASKTFEHMFSVPDQPETAPDETEGEIATIVLDISWKTIYALLASAYNRMEITALLARMSARARLDVYEAAQKYQFDQLAAWVSCCIQISASNMEASHALQVYIKASSYNDKDLADMVVNKAAESPLVLLSADDWGSLTIPTLMTLVQHQHARIRQLISAMPCQIHGQSSWGSARPASRMPCPLGPLEKIFPVIGPDWQNEYIPWPEQQWGSWGHEASFEDT